MQKFLCLLMFLMFLHPVRGGAHSVLIEAESFEQRGGWKLDTQFIQIMGSPYLLAHGMGKPVQDAITTVTLPESGRYRVWVRTKDWVARWDAPGQPGRFQLLVNGAPLDTLFGTHSAEWFWQDGGIVDLKDPHIQLALHDLTGFDGRCDAIFMSSDPKQKPPNENEVLPEWRRDLLGLKREPVQEGPYDLVIIGGGYAGTCSAISAARMGCKVALVQDRPVLGGNGSQEIRVSAHLRPWLMKIGDYPRLGEIVEEIIDHTRHIEPAGTFKEADERRLEIVRAEKNIDLFLNHFAYDVEKQGTEISAVIALDTRSSERRRFTGRLFADCTGHGTIGALAGADYDMTLHGHSGTTNTWSWSQTDTPHSFPDTPWALDLEMGDFPYKAPASGAWKWQSGFFKHPIDDLEAVRDWNLRAIFGAWNAMKNKSGAKDHLNGRLDWVAHVAGPRESRRLFGDIILNEEHIQTRQEFKDGLVPAAWFIDLHGPDKQYHKYAENPFIGTGLRERDYIDPPVHIPYRCLYSRNVNNLFMAGRDISATYEAHGLIRVMQTGGMMGEVVGKAASICIRYECLPRKVYERHLQELIELARLPGAARRELVTEKPRVP
ncbi:FAD-dependent oxidoreductase [candidate division KSB1 bacterium]|nr:FAD-dependent oxidoreductase [candidate division KSB1 bacterium]